MTSRASRKKQTNTVFNPQLVGEGERVPCVIIDPGHGGEDGGAVGADGILEKHLNLSVSENVRDIFTLFGIPVQMTREEAVALPLSVTVTDSAELSPSPRESTIRSSV